MTTLSHFATPLDLESVDVPADGNCFLHAARLTLLQLKVWNLSLVPTVATIRSEMIRFLRLNVIADGNSLDEVRSGMENTLSLDGQRSTRLEQYDIWSKYLTYMKQPDKYADTIFVFGHSSFYNVSVRVISDIDDEPQVYYLDFQHPLK